MDSEDRELLHAAATDRRPITITVTGCAYACCGHGWRRKDGYEQTYHGYIDNLKESTFMLYSEGLGTISYVVAVRFDEVWAIE